MSSINYKCDLYHQSFDDINQISLNHLIYIRFMIIRFMMINLISFDYKSLNHLNHLIVNLFGIYFVTSYSECVLTL